MLTAKEAQLGTLMARIAALGTIVIFAVQALLIGPDQVGYSEQYGAIVDIVSFIQSFGILFTISLTQKLFGDNKTKSDHGELLRTIGFSSAPGLIRVFGVTPELMTVTFIGSAFWMLACMVVAVKSALDYDSLWKAFGVVVVSWLVQAFFLFLIIVLFKGF